MDGTSFKNHRQAVVNIFHENGINTGIILYNSPPQPKEPFSESETAFTQEALFYWMTGYSLPNSAIVVELSNGRSTLVISGFDSHYEIWTGKIPSKEELMKQTGVDNVIDEEELLTLIESLKPPKIYSADLSSEEDFDVNNFPAAAMKARRIKFPDEVECLRKASDLTAQAIIKVLENVKPNMHEYEVQALFEFHGKLLGCRDVSFLTIAAAGQNSVYLHYSANAGQVHDGDLILLDCGLFYNHYAGDITRTFPANGKFSPDQRLVYSSLLKKQIELCQLVKPGVTFKTLNSELTQAVFEVLKEIGIVKNEPFNSEVSSLFCPHGISHHIGCNVHDQTYYGEKSDIRDSEDDDRTLRPNMIISIEPGIYFHKTRLTNERNNPTYAIVDFNKALQFAESVGGIRIEDDVLVTNDSFEILSARCPKTIEDIERIMSNQ